ncbi:MAG: hypothetical protein IJL02_11480 [Methanobrevibacter sp.]|uniref:hypothetical protein n=1 Tax=Methanobrevibacter sp. TaxID=66852 RepID=UPI0025EEE896|nr:hypothetical protein [Methanobrevibacter sp.]MBQ6100467.1 hypothetical protein [Methanobrevibacter sp.]
MKVKKPFHTYDATMKYSSMAFRKRQHQYLGLPGKYCRRYPTEVVLRNMETGRMDELYSVGKKDELTGKLTEYMLIDLEDESENVVEKTLKKFAKYKTFGSFIYSLPMYTAVTCKKNYINFPKEYKITETDIIRPHYIHFSDDELWEKCENVINKVKQNIKLSDNEALDIAFIPKYISQKYASQITESLAQVFSKSNIPDEELKRDIAVILMTMVLKNIPDIEKQNKLLEAMKMRKYKDDMEEIVYSIYGEELEKKDQEIEQQNQKLIEKDAELTKKDAKLTEKNAEITEKNAEINQYKKGIEQLKSLDDLNTPQAQKIINTLLLQK